jgi:hypothetical protein
MSTLHLLAVVTLALTLGYGGAAMAQSAEASDAPGGEGYGLAANGGRGMVGNLLLVGWSYNDGSR